MLIFKKCFYVCKSKCSARGVVNDVCINSGLLKSCKSLREVLWSNNAIAISVQRFKLRLQDSFVVRGNIYILFSCSEASLVCLENVLGGGVRISSYSSCISIKINAIVVTCNIYRVNAILECLRNIDRINSLLIPLLIIRLNIYPSCALLRCGLFEISKCFWKV